MGPGKLLLAAIAKSVSWYNSIGSKAIRPVARPESGSGGLKVFFKYHGIHKYSSAVNVHSQYCFVGRQGMVS